jgi:carbamate kinase
MGPKIQAAIDFVQKSVAAGRPNAWAAIGDLRDAAKIVTFEEGTVIRDDDSLKDGVIWRPKKESPGGATEGVVRKESKEPHKSG